MSEQRICYVIMPFDRTRDKHDETYWSTHFGLLKQIIEEIPNLEAIRSQPLRGDILTEIISRLLTSPVVVADLTDHNPNVFWELGVRQCRMHGTVTIAEEGTPRPFDIGHKAILSYPESDKVQWEEFRRQLKSAVMDCLEHPEKPDSPVLETIAGRGSLFELFRRDEAIRRTDALLMQLAYNHGIMKVVAETVSKNLSNPAEREYITGRFAISGIELLITNRYLDQKDEFYDKLEIYYEWLLRLNSQLNAWMTHPVAIEQWFAKMIDSEDIEKLFEEVKTLFMRAQNELSA